MRVFVFLQPYTNGKLEWLPGEQIDDLVAAEQDVDLEALADAGIIEEIYDGEKLL